MRLDLVRAVIADHREESSSDTISNRKGADTFTYQQLRIC